MSEDTKLKELIINTLSPEQMPEVLSDTEIYLVEDDVEYASVDELNQGLATKQDVINDLSTIRNNASTGAGLAPQVAVNTQRIEDLTSAKFPNVVIIGTPHIEGGQVTNYSDTSYLQFPFVDISRGQPFDIYFSFTTSNDVTTQQNILDSYFGIALAIQNSKGIMALSSNGTNWNIGTSTGTNTLLPNTTYYVKYSWTGTAYSAALSTNDETYVPDMNLTSSLSPHKTTIFIGGSPNLFGTSTAHPFKGTINFNKSKVVVNGITVWEGMADVGLASRANVSLNNLDEVGEARFNGKQDVITDLDTIRYNASAVSNKVSKSGDTMTGTLETDVSNEAGIGINIKSTYFNQLEDAQYNLASGVLDFTDNQNRLLGRIVNFKTPEGVTLFGFQHWYDSQFVSDFYIGRGADGKRWYSNPQIIASYVNGTSGYRVWSDGYCEQWGTVPSSPATINFIKTWANTDYNIVGNETGSDNNARPIKFNRDYKTINSIRVVGSANPLVISWKACGYLMADQY